MHDKSNALDFKWRRCLCTEILSRFWWMIRETSPAKISIILEAQT
jgi:hypothetical protein